jgi:hypothetical protein
MKMRDILSCQRRFRKAPGKQPLSFISRLCFAEAMEYFHFICTTTGEGMEIHNWWEQFVLGNLPPSAGETTGQQETAVPRAPAKRRKRKRRPKKGAGQQSP